MAYDLYTRGGLYDMFNPATGVQGLGRSAVQPQQNWLTDPEAPWNTWAQNLEGYLQDWVKSQRQGLLADLTQQNVAAGRQAIGQGLYTGTYTSSLPAENLARMMGQNAQNYAGALSGLQSNALAQLMSGQQQYGSQMLNATLEDLALRAQAQANSYGFGDFLGSLLGAIPGVGQLFQGIAALRNSGNQNG